VSYALLVDDNEDNLYYLGALLASESYAVERAGNGEEALEFARRVRPLVVVSDLLMPVMDGYTLLRHWKADPLLRDIPFIIYTATYTNDEDELLARQLGSDAYILKPYDPVAFLRRLREVLDRKVVAKPTVPVAAGAEVTALQAYNAALVRRLGRRTEQLNAASRELRQKIEEQSQQMARQLAIMNALPAQVALIDPQGVIVAVNAEWERFGSQNAAQRSDLGVGQNYLAVCERAMGAAEADARQACAGMRAVMSGELPDFSFEYGSHSATEQRWFRMSVAPLPGGQPTGVVVMHVEVTDRRMAEVRFQDSQEQILLLLDSTAEGIYGLDMEGTCTFSNATAARLLGYAQQSALIGVPFHERHHYSHADGRPYPRAECLVHTAPFTDQGNYVADDVLMRLDGSQFPVECWSYPARRAGVVVGLVVTFLDTTVRRTLEAKFLQAQKMEAIGRLAGGVAHDFNNALQVVLGTAELLGERLTRDPEGQRLLTQISTTGERAASLTRQLLAFSRKQVMRPVAIDLNEIITGLEGMLRPLIGEDVELTVLLDPQPQPVLADPGQMEQVLMNLAVNGRDAMPGGGRLVIRTATVQLLRDSGPERAPVKDGDFVQLTVTDTGCGMDEATEARIFEPFFTTKESGKGTGLGLSTVYGTVSQSGGHIEVRSEVGRGTTFTIYLPRLDGTTDPVRAPRATTGNPTGSETILLIEDEAPLRGLLAGALRAHGYTVLEAENGKRGIGAGCRSDPPIDLLLTDVILPDISGRIVADRILAHRPAIKVLFMSGYTADYMSRNGAIEESTMLLEKPFTHGAMLRMVRQVLDPGAKVIP
jgi:signal transduction histidine kinase/DNA-binding response OmpR family regulator